MKKKDFKLSNVEKFIKDAQFRYGVPVSTSLSKWYSELDQDDECDFSKKLAELRKQNPNPLEDAATAMGDVAYDSS